MTVRVTSKLQKKRIMQRVVRLVDPWKSRSKGNSMSLETLVRVTDPRIQ